MMLSLFAFLNRITRSIPLSLFLSFFLCHCHVSGRRPGSRGERGLHGAEGSPLHREPSPLQSSHLHDLLVRGGEGHQGESLQPVWSSTLCTVVCTEVCTGVLLGFFLSRCLCSRLQWALCVNSESPTISSVC